MLDFKGDILSGRWWQRAAMVSDYLLRKLRARAYEYKFNYNLALLSYDTTRPTFDLHFKQAEIARNSAINELMPWLDTGPKTVEETVAEMRRRYLKRFPDPRSKKGKEAIRKQLMKWGSHYARLAS